MPRPAVAARAGERGAAALEFALIAPMLFLLLFGGLETGRFLFVQASLSHALTTAARCHQMGVPHCATSEGIADHVRTTMQRLGAPDVPLALLRVAPAPCGVALGFRALHEPMLLPEAVFRATLRADACARVA